jgi:nitroimidazol reductase NimA-like FMN-containing flavoprotein (pyridoxamine 5'-phosphate oxidase superfamily)
MDDGLTALEEADCYALLRRRSLGRIGVHIDDQFVILPVYYALMDRDIVFRTSPGTKLSAAVLRTVVVFEVDSATPPAWSVLVRGHAQELREHDAQVRARSLLGHDWPAGEREHYVRVTVEHISGRRITAH